MRMFLSALENNQYAVLKQAYDKGERIHDGLISYYYLEKNMNNKPYMKLLDGITDHLLVDSGAHSFQKNVNVDWEEYTERYADWIQKNDSDKYLGFFEMDVDVKIGYERVKRLRRRLNQASDKIIPVWHKGRGIEEFKRMCHETKGDIVAVTGFRNEDIKDDQYSAFVKYA